MCKVRFFIPGGQSRWLEVKHHISTTALRQWFNGFNDVNSMSLLLHLVTSLPINQTQRTWCNESGKGKLLLRYVGMKPHGRNVFFPFEGKILQVIKKLSAATIPRGQRWGVEGYSRCMCARFCPGVASSNLHVYPQHCAPPSLCPWPLQGMKILALFIVSVVFQSIVRVCCGERLLTVQRSFQRAENMSNSEIEQQFYSLNLFLLR